MNYKAQDAANKIMLAFVAGGIVPLDLHQYKLIDAQVRSVLGRSVKSHTSKKNRKWTDFQRARAERQ
jgi:3-keto-L-gulonate-6-phosphate decarboxylase